MSGGLFTYFLRGETVSDPEWVQHCQEWHRDRFGANMGWPEDESATPCLLATWSHELHQGCGCRRASALIRTYSPYMFNPAEGPNRFPPVEGWYMKGDPHYGAEVTTVPIDPENRLWRRLADFGDSHELVLEEVHPGFVSLNIEDVHCSWDEAWGGGRDLMGRVIPYAPTSQANPWIPPMSSRRSDRWVMPPPTRGRD
jgi:hypothetical protein